MSNNSLIVSQKSLNKKKTQSHLKNHEIIIIIYNNILFPHYLLKMHGVATGYSTRKLCDGSANESRKDNFNVGRI